LDISSNTFAPGKTGEKLDTIPRSLPALTYCGVSNVGLPPSSIESFISSFWSNGRSETAGPIALDISHNNLGAEGGTSLARALTSLKYITEINLSYNKIPCAQLIEILIALKGTTGFEKLYLADNVGYGSDKDAARFVQELMAFSEQHPSLQVLDISTHAKAPKGVLENMFKMLGENKSLTSLDISGYRIGDAGAVSLAKALSVNTSLTQLAYDRNEITVTGWQCIAHVLERHPSMQHMEIPREDYRVQLANFSKNTLAFAKLVQSQSDISRFCIKNYQQKHTEPVKHSTCILDLDAPSSSYSKPVPIKRAERSTTHIVPSVSPEEVGEPADEDAEPVTTTSVAATASATADEDDESEKIDEDAYDQGGSKPTDEEEDKDKDEDEDGEGEGEGEGGDDDPPPPVPRA